MNLLKELLEMSDGGRFIKFDDWYAGRQEQDIDIVFPGNTHVTKQEDGTYTVIIGNTEPSFDNLHDAAAHLYINWMVPEHFDNVVALPTDKAEYIFATEIGDGNGEYSKKKEIEEYNGVSLVELGGTLYIVGPKQNAEEVRSLFDEAADESNDVSESVSIEDYVSMDIDEEQAEAFQEKYGVTISPVYRSPNDPPLPKFLVSGPKEKVEAFISAEYSIDEGAEPGKLEDGFYVLFTFSSIYSAPGRRADKEYLMHGPIEKRAVANKYKNALEDRVRARSMREYTTSGRVLNKKQAEAFAEDVEIIEADFYTLDRFQ